MLHVDRYCKMAVGDLKRKVSIWDGAPFALVALRGHSE